MSEHLLSVECPTCKAPVGARCRTLRTGKPTAPHRARLEARYPRCTACGLQEATHPIETCRTFIPGPPSSGYVLGYYIEDESWYREATARIGEEAEIALTIGLYATRGGCCWEFTMTREPVSGGCLRVRLFDDAWDAFTAIPGFFAGLADLGRGADVGEVVDLMNTLGFRDLTKRTSPSAGAVGLL